MKIFDLLKRNRIANAEGQLPNAFAFSQQSAHWTRHFERNRDHMNHVPWEMNEQLSKDEQAAISKSIATFQLGENAEGTGFKRAGHVYAEKTGDFEYLKALHLFIKEEQMHSAVLGRFMDHHNIQRIEKEWTDSTFRWVRRLAGLNVCITVLITAEIIAATYYRALGQATRSVVLRSICGQILIDESHHLQFQASTLAKQRVSWHPLKRWLFRQLHRALLLCTMIVVWREHRAVFLAGCVGFFQWMAATWSVLENVLLTIQNGTMKQPDGTYELPLPPQTETTLFPGLPSMRFRQLDATSSVGSPIENDLAGRNGRGLAIDRLHEISALFE